ncbi:MAG: dienelactone hydrolase family protein [Candidatus Promineifilaceae bacterium]|nr:dienelactone hydrolase family protein [Candidatus Promineifilaceae bacterium]
MNNDHPHKDQPIMYAGQDLADAQAALILVHGRGASAADILTLVPELDRPDFAYLAPLASGNTWYPYSFLAPIPQNEPGISSGMAVLSHLIEQIVEAGIPHERIMIGGFSQGACLATEFVARHARRYGGVLGFSGGLIGPDGTPRDYEGDLAGTPVFLGCSDVDPHIPKARVGLTADVLQRLGGDVTLRLYRGMGHTINQDEIEFAKELMAQVAERPVAEQEESA